MPLASGPTVLVFRRAHAERAVLVALNFADRPHEVELAGAVVRVVPGMDDTTQLTAVLRAIRASASRR